MQLPGLGYGVPPGAVERAGNQVMTEIVRVDWIAHRPEVANEAPSIAVDALRRLRFEDGMHVSQRGSFPLCDAFDSAIESVRAALCDGGIGEGVIQRGHHDGGMGSAHYVDNCLHVPMQPLRYANQRRWTAVEQERNGAQKVVSAYHQRDEARFIPDGRRQPTERLQQALRRPAWMCVDKQVQRLLAPYQPLQPRHIALFWVGRGISIRNRISERRVQHRHPPLVRAIRPIQRDVQPSSGSVVVTYCDKVGRVPSLAQN